MSATQKPIITSDGNEVFISYTDKEILEVYLPRLDLLAEIHILGDELTPRFQAAFPDIAGCADLMFEPGLTGTSIPGGGRRSRRVWIITQTRPIKCGFLDHTERSL